MQTTHVNAWMHLILCQLCHAHQQNLDLTSASESRYQQNFRVFTSSLEMRVLLLWHAVAKLNIRLSHADLTKASIQCATQAAIVVAWDDWCARMRC